jgi:zinc protease
VPPPMATLRVPRSSRPFLARLEAPLASALLLGLAASTGCAASLDKPGALPAGAQPGAAAAADAPLPLDPKVTSGTLPNGLTYYVERQKAEDKRVRLALVVKAGSLYEDDDQRGLAHFVEHMAFNGTRRFPKQTLVEFFEQNGMRFGSHANAATSYDRTIYQLTLPSDDPSLVLKGLDVLEDWSDSLSFDAEEVEKERKVVLSEWVSAQGVARRLGEQTRRLVLYGSRYAERETIGTVEVLEQAKLERIAAFYKRWYRPERMAVIAVGDLDPATLKAAIEQRFTRLAPSPVELLPPSRSVPVRQEPIYHVMTDPETTASSANLAFKQLSVPARTEQEHRFRLVSSMVAHALARRLDEQTLDPNAPFTGASSGVLPGVFGAIDLVQVTARAKDGQLLPAIDALLLEVERVRRYGFSQAELERERTEYGRSLERLTSAEQTEDIGSVALGLTEQFVTGNVVMSAEYESKLGARLIQEISVAELNQVAKRWFEDAEELVWVTAPGKDKAPERSALVAKRGEVIARQISPYVERSAGDQLMAELPKPGAVTAEEQITELGVTVWTLSNGARVVLKPTDFKADEIAMRAVSFGGNARVPAEQFAAVRYAAEIVGVSGLGTLDRLGVVQRVSGKVVSARPFIDEQEEGIVASSAPKDVETMLQLVHLYATAPRRDEAAFQTLKNALREQVKNRDLSPQQVYGDAVAKQLWGNEPRRLPPTLESLDALDLDRSLELYRDRFSDVSDFTFVFVGKIDTATLKPLVERYIASLPGGGRQESFKDIGLHRKKGITRVVVKRGQDDKVNLTLVHHGELKWSDPAHTDLVTLEGYLAIRLREVLREELGAVYTPIVQSRFDRVPYEAYSLVISLECKSSDVAGVERALREVLRQTKQSGAEQSYLDKLISQRTRGLEEDYRSNGFWLGRLASSYERGEDPRRILDLHDLTKRITKDNLRRAAQTYLRDDQYLDARLLPEQPAPVTPAATSTPAEPSMPAAPVAPAPSSPAPSSPAAPKSAP